ncbi:hypothetical protein LCGC14_2962920, partial [marine sediment metagenome]
MEQLSQRAINPSKLRVEVKNPRL